MTLLATLRELVAKHGTQKTYWVAYSGGMDSHVLLSLCHALRNELPIKLHAIHINHQLNPNASVWALHCQNICHEYDIPYREFTLTLTIDAGDSVEEIARNERYKKFADVLKTDDVLLTAHHQQDQAETFLLQLLRGAGLKGLAAMPSEKKFARGVHVRPLLNCSHTELQAYAEQEKLSWIVDDSNADTRFARNFLRHTIISQLEQQWPSAIKTIVRSANHCAEAQQLLDDFAKDNCANVAGSHKNTLSVQKLLQLTQAQQRLILRAWIRQQNFPLPNTSKMSAVLQDVLLAAWDRSPCVTWGDVELRRYRDDLFLMSALTQFDVTAEYQWNFSAPLTITGVGVLQAEKKSAENKLRNLDSVTVRFRQGGEMISLAKRGNHTLKNLLNEWNVLPWLRERVPLLFYQDKLIAVVGFYIHPDFVTGEAEEGWKIVCS